MMLRPRNWRLASGRHRPYSAASGFWQVTTIVHFGPFHHYHFVKAFIRERPDVAMRDDMRIEECCICHKLRMGDWDAYGLHDGHFAVKEIGLAKDA